MRVDRRAEAFVQDLHAEDLAAGGGAILVGRGQGDVEGQDLVAVPGQGDFLEALDVRQRDLIELIDGGIDRESNVPGQSGVEDSPSARVLISMFDGSEPE